MIIQANKGEGQNVTLKFKSRKQQKNYIVKIFVLCLTVPEAAKLQFERLLCHKERKWNKHTYKASHVVHHKWPKLMADLVSGLMTWVYSFILFKRKTEKSSVIRSISPEWKTGFRKQIQGDKEFHKIEIRNSFSIGFQSTENNNMQSLFLNIKKMWVKVLRMKKQIFF